MGAKGSKEIEYSVMIKQSQNPDLETGIYRNPLAQDGLKGDKRSAKNRQIDNLKDAFMDCAEVYGSQNCIGKREDKGREGQFVYDSYSQVRDKALQLGAAIDKMELAPVLKEYNEMEIRFVAIYGKNSYEWLLADLACNLKGITTVAIYDTLGADSMRFILDQTNTNTLFTSVQMLPNIISQDKLATINTIVYFEQQDQPETEKLEQLRTKGYTVLGLNEVMKNGQGLELKPNPNINKDTISTISYTSGTTGNPKGVLLSHGNIVSTIGGLDMSEVTITHNDFHLSYLPMAHIFERLLSYTMLISGATVCMFNGNVLKLKEDLADVRPTIFGSVPRLFNRFYDLMNGQFSAQKGIKKVLLDKALSTKLYNLKNYAYYTHQIFDKLMFNKTKSVFGGRARLMITGSAPISSDVLNQLKVTACCPLLEGYGQTESCGGSFMTNSQDITQGHVGGPLTAVEFKIQAVPDMEYNTHDKDEYGNITPRGELLLRGNAITLGYYKEQQKTDEAINQDGWLHTGDIVRLNPNGSISIIDRKKNIFKLAQGEYVAAEKLEIGYRNMAEIEECFIYGDSLQAFLVTIIYPNEKSLRLLAEQSNLTDLKDKPFEEIIKSNELCQALQKKIAATAKQMKFNGIEVPKQITLVPKPFIEYDIVTTSFKLKRHEAKKVFISDINRMYKQ